MKRGNRKKKARFTQLLEELVCIKKMDLKSALQLMSKADSKQEKVVRLAAQNIYDSLLGGVPFSNALKSCPFIEFDMVYISFMNFAQRCGCVEEALGFLKKKCEREIENLELVVQALIYPVFVIVMAVTAGIVFSVYTAAFWTEMSCKEALFMAFGFLTLFCITAFFLLRKTLGINKLYEAFLAMGFLINGGESIANAVNAAVNILGYETKEGQFFAQAGEKLSFGMNLKDSFALNTWNKSLRTELEEAFFYAENSGGENDVFEKIALWLNVRDEKRRAICLKLIEPVFISGTGIFLLIFLVNLVLPLFSESTFFL